MNPENLALFIPISGVIGTVLILYIHLTTRNKERMMMIERGQSLDFTQRSRKKDSLRWGLLLTGLGLGLFVGHQLHMALQPDFDAPIYHFAMSLVFGGAGLVAHHFLSRNDKGKGNDEDFMS